MKKQKFFDDIVNRFSDVKIDTILDYVEIRSPENVIDVVKWIHQNKAKYEIVDINFNVTNKVVKLFF